MKRDFDHICMIQIWDLAYDVYLEKANNFHSKNIFVGPLVFKIIGIIG